MPRRHNKDSSKGHSSNTETGEDRFLRAMVVAEDSGDSVSTSDLPIFKRLTLYSRESFEKLCDLGCDPRILNDYLGLLPPRKLPPKTLSPRKAKQIAKRAKKVLADMGYLEKLYIMDVMFPLPVDDHTPHSEVPYATRVLQEMAELPKFIQEVWPLWNPTYASLLSVIYNHIHTETKGWKDELLADILCDLLPSDPDHPINGESLKQWRHRHDLKDNLKAK